MQTLRFHSENSAIKEPELMNRMPPAETGHDAVVETTSGRLRGLQHEGAHSFKGIRYGDSTEGALRFAPPQPVTPWTGIRDATQFGPSAPQHFNQMPGNYPAGPPPIPSVYKWYWSDLPISEDCLSLNVFTPSLEGAGRPVMVWLHGGAFANGAGTAPGFDGTNLARDGDVVVVTVNHRLNIFGHLFLGSLGNDRFADAANNGLADIVAALEWVRDNIESFGGDPANVTIFGESGGGSKVAYLMSMPSAKGLFHKAIIQSSGFRAMDESGPERAAGKVLKSLGLTKDTLDQLGTVPVRTLLDVMSAVNISEGGNDYFRPANDGRSVFERPFHQAAPDASSHIPLMMGTCEAEATFMMATNMEIFTLPRAKLVETLATTMALRTEAAEALFASYEEAHPNACPIDVFKHLRSDALFRAGTIHAAQHRARQPGAPLYKYCFAWKSPVLNGILGASHTLEIPFVFGNTDLTPEIIGHAPDRHEVTKQVMGYWVNFARTGNPNGTGLSDWPAYTLERRDTMVINRTCSAVADYRGKARELSQSFHV